MNYKRLWMFSVEMHFYNLAFFDASIVNLFGILPLLTGWWNWRINSRFRCMGEGSPSLQTRIEGQHRNHTAETLIFCQEPTPVIFFCARPLDKNVKNSKILGFFMLLRNPIQRHKPSTRSMGFTVSSFSIVWIACDGNSQSICIPPNAMLEASRSAGIHLKAWQGNVPPPFRFRCSHRGDLVRKRAI